MAWCPICKSEYVEGITKCVDCNCDLVEALEETEETEEEVTVEMAMAMQEAMIENEEETGAEYEALDENPGYVTAYQNSAEKAEDNRSSAYTLLSVGIIGFILVVLFFFDVLPIRLGLVNKYMLSGVMGVLFILFIVMGFLSMKKSKILLKKATKENNLTMEIHNWCVENLQAQKIDAALDDPEAVPEEKYLKRCEQMKKLISTQFMNLDEGFLERFIDEFYPEIFE